MRQWLTKNWSDPVWSKVIAAAICGASTSAWLWSRSHFSFNLDTAWSAAAISIKSIWTWLVDPSSLPQGIVWLTFVVFACLAWWQFDQHRRQLRNLTAHWSAKVQEQVQKALDAQIEEETRRARNLTVDQQWLLNQLYVRYGESGGAVKSFAEKRRLLHAAAQTQCDRLIEMGLLKTVSHPYSGFPPMLHLTREGREFCEKHGLDKLPV